MVELSIIIFLVLSLSIELYQMYRHLKRGLINNFVTGLTPFLYKRASMHRLVLHSGK